MVTIDRCVFQNILIRYRTDHRPCECGYQEEVGVMDNILIKKERNPLKTTLHTVYYIIIFGLIFWGFSGIEYKGIMQTAASSMRALLNALTR